MSDEITEARIPIEDVDRELAEFLDKHFEILDPLTGDLVELIELAEQLASFRENHK